MQDTVRGQIERELASPFLPLTPTELIAMIPGLDEYIELRVRRVTDLSVTVKREASSDKSLYIIPTTLPPTSHARLLYGTDPVLLARTVDSLTVCGYFTDEQDLRADLDLLLNQGVPAHKIRVGLRPQAPDSFSFENFMSKLSIVAERNLAGVSFYNFGQMRASSFAWIQEGLRVFH